MLRIISVCRHSKLDWITTNGEHTLTLKREFNAVKYDEFDWCSELSQNASKNAIHNLGDAVTRWKKGQNSFPVYKKRSDRISYQADNGTGTVEVRRRTV